MATAKRDEKAICPRAEDYARWYTDLVLRSELADYSPVAGCMVIRPNGYGLWEKMRDALDGMFKETGHRNAYFPMFIPVEFLAKEAQHVEGFAMECGVVTHSGLEADPENGGLRPKRALDSPLVLRPTSETIIWHMYGQWINSYRDLPILINQWANVVRWEMRTRLFLRTREFLWQEGHTAHATAAEAVAEATTILEVYRRFAEEYMAVPVLTGLKTEAEKFAGAVDTYTLEALTQDGRAIQAGTSHYLGQNFAKAFDVTFQTAENTRDFVYATSWGVSTRLIGALVMCHSDDKGLVLPPRLATNQVVVVPIGRKDEEKALVAPVVERLRAELKPFDVIVDSDDSKSPGFKFAEWELRGIPLRIECGRRDVEAGQLTLARRDTGEKKTIPLAGDVAAAIRGELDVMQQAMFQRALDFRAANTRTVETYDEFKEALGPEGGAGFLLAHWDGTTATEKRIQEETNATIRCLPDQFPAEPGRCIVTGEPSARRVVFARSY
ncbi:MAG: proline--tRNA ligase [Fimbriimonadaceae bacterium]|nr:proline--tRNA ligase [Fimbriimonadaceae bacterium]